jgi:DNA polymerase-3 subunit gamma/tau
LKNKLKRIYINLTKFIGKIVHLKHVVEMEKFIVSARKYRPQTFRTVVGQSHITDTLKNSIKTNHLAQAFLFCGPRGVGKTTCARILAKTINCTQLTSETEACDQCESCLSFNTGQSLNVYELDAASNNKVEDIRSLIEQVRFAPQLGEYKVYIIDEVHMLSTAAFNAFLKTLEEPPKHAIFILATTEKHKIIPTILSRCQIFDFNRIKVDDISKHLAWIAKTENVQAESEALHVIAQKADGGLRDACSMFDQMVTFSGGNLSYTQVIENLHVLDYDYYFKVVDALNKQQMSQVLLIYDEILKKGFDGHNFIVGLGEHVRNLLVSKDAVTLPLLEVSEAVRAKYGQQANECSTIFLLKVLSIVNRVDVSYKSAKNQRLQVEIGLMQMSHLNAATTDAEKKNDTEVSTPVQISKSTPSTFSEANTKKEYPTTDKPFISWKDVPLDLGFRMNDIKKISGNPITPLEEKTHTEEPILSEAFTFEQVEAALKMFVDEKIRSGERNLAITLSKFPPELRDTNRLVLKIENEVQREMLKVKGQDILDFIRKEIRNNGLSLETQMADINQSEKAIYSPGEKFEALANRNQWLLELKKKFDLEIDF